VGVRTDHADVSWESVFVFQLWKVTSGTFNLECEVLVLDCSLCMLLYTSILLHLLLCIIQTATETTVNMSPESRRREDNNAKLSAKRAHRGSTSRGTGGSMPRGCRSERRYQAEPQYQYLFAAILIKRKSNTAPIKIVFKKKS